MKIFALGSNGSGQLGIGHLNDVSEPTECQWSDVQPKSRPVRIAAGGNTTLVLFEDGFVFAAGDNSNGQCGVPQQEDPIVALRQVHFTSEDGQKVEKFKLVASTWEASTFITRDEHVYTCGNGNKGELGLGDGVKSASSPQRIIGWPPSGTRIVDLGACMSHTAAVLSDGTVYGWGSGRKGQLGTPLGEVWYPRKVNLIPFHALRAVCGREFTLVVGSSSEGAFTVIGSDKWTVKSSAPTSLGRWKNIAASWGSIFVLDAEGGVRGWGRGDHGQMPTLSVSNVSSLVAGSEHAMAQTTPGNTMAWGWGEHGNCGTPTSDNGDVVSPNILLLSTGAYPLGAGCATTFIASMS